MARSERSEAPVQLKSNQLGAYTCTNLLFEGSRRYTYTVKENSGYETNHYAQINNRLRQPASNYDGSSLYRKDRKYRV
jgi:hypothetical protein